MKPTTFKGTVESAYGKKLETALTIEGTYDKLEKTDVTLKEQLIKTGEWPNDADVIEGYINPRRLAKARAKATTEAYTAAGIKKPEASDPEVIYKNLLKQFRLAKMSDEQAETMARQVSGFTGEAGADEE